MKNRSPKVKELMGTIPKLLVTISLLIITLSIIVTTYVLTQFKYSSEIVLFSFLHCKSKTNVQVYDLLKIENHAPKQIMYLRNDDSDTLNIEDQLVFTMALVDVNKLINSKEIELLFGVEEFSLDISTETVLKVVKKQDYSKVALVFVDYKGRIPSSYGYKVYEDVRIRLESRFSIIDLFP